MLGDKTFPLVKKAIADRDVEGLKAFLDPAFEGHVFVEDGGTPAEYPFAHFRTWKEGANPLEARDRDGFAAEILKYRDELKELSSAGVKIMKMSPVTHGDLTGPWAGSFKLILGGRTRDGKVAQRIVQFRCRVKEITEETPKKRGWFLRCDAYAAKYSRTDDFLTSNMTEETGINVKRLQDNWVSRNPENIPFLTGGLYLSDVDQDGLVDLLVTDLNGILLYRSLGSGRFADATEQMGLPARSRTLGGVFADFDGDGYEDLLLGPQLYRNEGGRRFRPLKPDEHRLPLESQSFKYAVADYDRDGKLDLYIVGLKLKGESESKRTWLGKNRISRNQLWRNLGGFRFEDVTEKSGTAGNGSSVFAAVWFDANGDDWPDMMTSCEFGTNDYFLNNRDGTFRTGELPAGYGGFSMGITVNDIDNDGFGDPYVANMYSKAGERVVGNLNPALYPPDVYSQMTDFVSGNELYRNRGDGKFERIGQSAGINDVGWAFGTGFGDLNGDGFPDLYSPVGFQSISRAKPDG